MFVSVNEKNKAKITKAAWLKGDDVFLIHYLTFQKYFLHLSDEANLYTFPTATPGAVPAPNVWIMITHVGIKVKQSICNGNMTTSL